VPVGKTPEENLKRFLKRVKFLFCTKGTTALISKKYDIIDFELGNKIAGISGL
jgi:hypothetical protein